MKTVGIIGAGVVGTAVGVILSSKGYEITGVYDVVPESTKLLCERTSAKLCQTPGEVSRSAEILFISTSDTVIRKVIEEIAASGDFFSNQLVVHMSGALTSEVLSSARENGALTVSIHPMQSFANADRAISNLPGSIFSIEGDKEAFERAAALVKDLDGDSFVIDKKAKPLYHAGACVVSNYLVTLVDMGLQLLESIGIPRDKGLAAVMPLINGTVKNIEKIGIPKALTGPIARGDLATVLKHLDGIQEMAPDLIKLYCLLGYYTAEVAAAKGTVGRETTEELKQIFEREIYAVSSVRGD